MAVLLNCQLMKYKQVHNVTWQKISPGGERTVATYSRYFGEIVNPDFQGKVKFRKAELLNSSIVIREVTEQDEGCYHCLFYTWPDGDLSGLTCIRLYGGAVLIQTQSEVTARLGDQVDLNCLLTQSWDVRQITWQKVSPGGERTVATYNKDFGQRVNASFSDKVEIRDCGLLNSSIVIRKLTQQDEGCYKCMFNTYPRGAFFGLTCITPYELYGPVLHVRGQNSTRDLVVSCSASGRPPPSMEITFPHQDLYLLKTSSDYVLNDNSTVTVTMTAVLSRLHHNSVLVGCAAQVLSLPQTKVLRMISEVEQTPAAEGESEAGNISRRSAALVQTQKTVVAAVGEEVLLTGQLMEYKQVHQVTWQKILLGGERTVATYSRYSGEIVSPDFQGKVKFKKAELLNSSIVIREVTEQDEGCYRCLFNTWPDGDLSGLTCIRLYELYGPVLHIRGQNSTRDVVVSCSASGRPPPSVEITFPHQDLYLLKTSSDYVLNDSTVTVTMTAVLSRFHHNSVPVGCAAQVLSLPQTKSFRVFLEVEPKPAAEIHKGESEAGNISHRRTLILVLVVLAILIGLSVALFVQYKFKKQTSLPHVSHQMVETSSAADRDP